MAGLAWALKREADAAEAEDVAIEQKEKAQEARGAADEIVTAMTTDVRWELEKFGRSHQVADLMKTAREYLQNLSSGGKEPGSAAKGGIRTVGFNPELFGARRREGGSEHRH